MGGLIMEFSEELGTTDVFDLPDQFNTASICPVAGSTGTYTIQPLLDGVLYGAASPTLADITSFPEGTRTWSAHRITCITGSVIVKYQRRSLLTVTT